jgi:predicted ArsR family transcriptional regulator
VIRDDLERVALLAEPNRWEIYREVLRRGELGRDAAARALRITRSLAAFHLDRLAEAGLLEVGFRRLSGRTGPGAGRPAKVYRPAHGDLAVTVPPRNHELAARILAEAVRADSPGRLPLARVARRAGRAIGEEARRRAGPRPGRDRLAKSVAATLEDRGFQPTTSDGELRMANCPFGALSTDYRDVVCRLNLALLEGVARGAGLRHLRPVADRRPGMCCVVFRPVS